MEFCIIAPMGVVFLVLLLLGAITLQTVIAILKNLFVIWCAIRIVAILVIMINRMVIEKKQKN